MEGSDNRAATINPDEPQERFNMGDVEAGKGNPNDPPPAYSPGSHDPREPPPSYNSLVGQVQTAKDESSGNVDFFKKFITIIFGTIGCTIFVGFLLAIPISMICMGAIFKDDCPRERYIPIYLIVGGSFGLFKNLINMGQRFKNRKDKKEEENAKPNAFDSLLNLFLFAWFIAGSVWIYHIHHKFQTEFPEQDDYCEPRLYWYAFWMTTAKYIVIASSIFFAICSCVLGCCCCCLASKKGDTNATQH